MRLFIWLLLIGCCAGASVSAHSGTAGHDPTDMVSFADGAAVPDTGLLIVDDPLGTPDANGHTVKTLTWANLEAHFAEQSALAAVATTGSFADLVDEPVTVSQAEAEAGIATTDRLWTAQRVAQAVAALESAEVNDLTAAVTWTNVPNVNITQSSVTQHEGALNHDNLTGFVVNEHIDWTLASQGTIHSTNYVDNDTQLTQEQVEDIAGALLGNVTGTHTGITITYQDDTDDIDLVVDHDAASNFAAGEHVDWSLSGQGTIHASNYADNDTLGGLGGVNGDVLYYDSGWQRLAKGADGQVLELSGGLPSWGTDDTGAGGSPVVLDLTDDDINESADIAEIATTGDTNNIFTEPVADKLLIAVGNNWPTADTANAGDTATAFFSAGTIEHERGGLEADVSAYNGLVRINGGTTTNVTNLAGLNTAIGASIADGAHTTEVNDLTSAVTWANVPDANITQSSVTQHEGAINHDNLTGFVVNEHIDWTLASQGTIHATNYVDNNTQLTQEQVDDFVDLLINDVDSVHTRIAITYDDINDAMDFVVDNMINTASNLGAGVGVFETASSLDIQFNSLVSQNNILTIAEDDINDEVDFTVNQANIDHDALTNYAAGEHIDWSLASQGTIHATNYTDNTLNLAGAETITGNWVNTNNPWADNEVSDTLTVGPGGVVTGDIAGGFLDASGFAGNLTTADDTFQEVAQAFNDFGSSPGVDSIGTSELDDAADTPNSGDYIRVDTVDQAGVEYRSPAEVRTDISAAELGKWPKEEISVASTTIDSTHFGKLLVLDASSNNVSLAVNTGLAADGIFWVYVIDATNTVSIDGTATINDTTTIPSANTNTIITVFHTHTTDTWKIVGNEPMVEFISGIIAEPSDTDYLLSVNIPLSGTITETTTKSTAGTCTATFKVNTTALGGTANSVSVSENIQSHSTTNTFSAGDDINLTVSANSSAANLSFTIKYEYYP